MARDISLIYDRERATLLDSFERLRPVSIADVLEPVRFGDSYTVSLYFGTIQHDRGFPYFRTESIAAEVPNLFLYDPGAPWGSTLVKFTYGASSTNWIRWEDATVELVERHLNELSTIADDGGVEVTGSTSSLAIQFGDQGAASSTISVDIDSPYGYTTAIADSVTGDASAREVQHVSILRGLISSKDGAITTLGSSAPTITRTEVVTGDADLREIVEWSISPAPEGGTFRLLSGTTPTVAIHHDASADEVETAINGVLGASKVTCEKIERARWRVYFASVGAQTPMTSSNTDLKPRIGAQWTFSVQATPGYAVMGGRDSRRLSAMLELTSTSQALALGHVDVSNRYVAQTPA